MFWRSENISRLDTKHKSLTQMTRKFIRTSNACLSAVRAKLKTFSSFNRFGVWILLFAIVIEQQSQREILPFENAMYGRLCVCLCDDDDVVDVGYRRIQCQHTPEEKECLLLANKCRILSLGKAAVSVCQHVLLCEEKKWTNGACAA